MEIQDLLEHLRSRGAETTRVEVKAASSGCPKSLRETISAFANLSGGTILLGLSDGDFQPVPLDAPQIRDALAGMAADDMAPPIRGEIEIELVDGDHRIVRMDVAELDPTEKPCFVTAKGMYGGSYVRGGDGDRRLSHYEVDRLLENRKQPEFDREPVQRATLEDLDSRLVDSYVQRMVRLRPRAFDGLGHDEILRRLNLSATIDGNLHPTLSALLTFGIYPQEFFPQLCVTVVALPGTTMGDLGPQGERFIDNVTCDGPLPSVAAEAIAAIIRNMTRAAIVSGVGRTDRYEYPLEVVRELILNAVLHRDYSPGARGAQVQVELYPDRLVVRSPGGFYGPVDPVSFGEPDVSSSRNALLARILADMPALDGGQMLVENRGSGIPSILRSLHRAGMVPPEFRGDFKSVQVTVPHNSLITPQVLDWINGLREERLSTAQVQALGLLKGGRSVRNQTLQGWGIHAADATRDLSDLVRRGLAVKIGDRRGATYELASSLVNAAANERVLTRRQRDILQYVKDQGEVGSSDVSEAIRVSRATSINDLNALIEAGEIEATAPPRDKRRTYRVAGSSNGASRRSEWTYVQTTLGVTNHE